MSASDAESLDNELALPLAETVAESDDGSDCELQATTNTERRRESLIQRKFRARNPRSTPSQGDYGAVLRTPAYWSCFLQHVFLNAIGSGFIIGNLSYLTGSFGFERKTREQAVDIVSYANMIGRLLVDF